MSDMNKVYLDIDGEALEVIVLDRDGRRVSHHIIHALGVNGSLAYFRGGPMFCADDAPREAPGRAEARR